MSNVSFGNLTTSNYQQISPELQKRIESQESFGAIDTEKLKQDTVEIASKAQTQVEENFIFKTLRNVFGVQDPKKFLFSVGLTIATTLGFAALGNKFNKQIIKFSQDVIDKHIKKIKLPDFITNIGKGINNKTNNFVSNHARLQDTLEDIKETFTKRKSGPVQPLAKTIGPKGQFCYNVSDTAQAIHTKFQGDDFKALKKAYGGILNPKSRQQAVDFLKSLKTNEINIAETMKMFGSKGIKKAQLDTLVQDFIKHEDSLSLFGRKEKITAFLGELKKLGLNDDEAASLYKQLGKLSEHARKVDVLKASELGEQGAEDLIKNLNANNRKLRKSIKKLVGKEDAEYFIRNFMEADADDDRANFARKLTAAIAKKHGVDPKDPKALSELLEKLKKDGLGDDNLLNITMNREGIIQRWAPANGVEWLRSHTFLNKIFKKPFGKGNLGDALIKFNMADGTLAETAAGKFFQKVPLYLGESVSNHVADLSTMNLFITVPMLLDLFNTVQEAPKEQKGATIADNFVGGLGQFALSMPLASAMTYGVATLKNLKNNKNPLKWIGKLIGMGLPTIKNGVKTIEPSFIKRFAGGAFRFWAIMFFLSPKISDAITKLTHKVFGKPYDKEEAEKQRLLEEQKKQLIPELGITQGELMEKMEKNPEAMIRLQNDEKLAYTIEQNPKAILDLLDGKEIQYIEPPKSPASQGVILSPANRNRLNNQTSLTPNNQANYSTTNNTPASSQKIADSATYIP